MDQYYIEEGYYDAGYFVYTAVAAAAVSSTVTVSATTAKSVSVSQSMAVAVSLACTISHIEGADLVAFSNALVTTSGDRIRGISSTLSSVGSLSCNATLIPASNEAAADLSVSISMTITVGKILSAESLLSVVFTQVSTPDYFRNFASTLQSNITQEAAVRRIRDNNITASAVFSVATDATRTRNLSSDDAAEFSFTANTVLARSRDYASSQSAAFSLAAAIDNRTRDQSSSLASQFAVTAIISHIEGADLVAFTNAAVTTTATRIKQFSSSITAESSIIAGVTRNPGIIQNLSSQFTQSASAVSIPRVIVSLSSAFTFFTDYDKLVAGPVAVSGGSYDTAVINTSTTKFGAGSLGWTLDADVFPTSDVFWTGTEFVTANTSYKWTSSNGTSWTRTAITGAKIPLNYANGYFFNSNQYSTDLNTWSTISYATPNIGFISSIGYAGGIYYIFGSYTRSSRYEGLIITSSTLAGTWTATGQWDGGPTSTGYPVSLLNFKQASDHIAVVVTGITGRGTYAYYFAGSNTNLNPGLPTLSINTNNFVYEGFNDIAAKSSTQYLVSVRDTQNPRRDGIVYKNGASGGAFVFGTTGGSDQQIKYVINDIFYINSTWLVYTSGGVFKSTATVPTSFSDFTLTSDQSLGTLAYGASKYVSSRFYSSDATTWTPNVPGNTTGYQGSLEYSQGDGSDLGNFSTIDFWAYVPDVISIGQWPLRIVSVSNQTNFLQFELYKTSGAASFIRLERVTGDVNDDQTHFVSSGDASQGWHHIRISASGSNLAVYYDGVRKIYRTDFSGTFAGKVKLQSSQLLIDDFLISDTLITNPSVASFTVPTIRSAKDAGTDLLLRFDTDFSNLADLAPVIPRASISAVSSVSATAKKTAGAACSLSSEFTQTSEATVLVLFEAALASEASTSATVLRIKSSGVTLDSAFTHTANTDLSRIRTTSSVQSSAFTQSTEAVKTADIVLALNSQATFTATISHIEGADLVAFSNAALTANNERTRSGSGTFAVAATQTTQAQKTVDAISNQSSSISQTASVVVVRDAVSNVNSSTSLTASASRTRDLISSQSSEFAQTTAAARIRGITSSLTAQASQSTIGNATKSAVIVTQAIAIELAAVIKVANADQNNLALITVLGVNTRVVYSASKALTTTATVVGNAKKNVVTASSLNVIASQTAIMDNRTRSQTANVAAVSSIAVTASKFSGPLAFFTSAVTHTIDYTRIRDLDSSFYSVIDQSVQGRVTRTTSASLSTVSTFTATISHIEGADLVANNFATLTAIVDAGKFANADLVSQVTQSVSITRTRSVISSQASAFTQSATADNRTRNQTAALSTAATLTCTISHIEGADLVAFSASAVTTSATKITRTSVNATSAFNLTATVDKFRRFNANLAASTSLSANGLKLVTTQATLQAQTTILANATKVVQMQAVIASAMTFVITVTEINAEMLTQFIYTIPAEDWAYTISQESREVVLEQETRLYTIRSS